MQTHLYWRTSWTWACMVSSLLWVALWAGFTQATTFAARAWQERSIQVRRAGPSEAPAAGIS